MSEQITADDLAHLRAQIEAKQEELLAALNAVSGQNESPGSIADQFFRLLGITTFWLAQDAPSERAAADVRRALAMFRVEVRG